MQHDSLEAQMGAIMTETTAKPQQPQPQKHHISKRIIAAMMLGAALFGALISGLFSAASRPPSPVSNVIKTIEKKGCTEDDPNIDAFFFNIGIGRYHK